MWYVGKEFDKKKNKEYKTLDGGLKAAEKNGLNLYDEDGQLVGAPEVHLTDDENGNAAGTVNAEKPETRQESAGTAFDAGEDNSKADAEKGQERAHSDAQMEETVHGKIRRVFDGKLRLRRSPSWSASVACGVTMFVEKTVTQRVMVDGAPMYRTTDGYYVSGKPEHVEFIED